MLASFWGMKAPAVIPTCTTWSTLHDQGQPITQGTYRRYYRYLESVRRSALTAVRDSDAESVVSATPLPPRKSQGNMDTLLSLVDTTWYPNLHQGLDYLWTIMNESERESFLKGITTERTSTSMSTVVPMISRSAPSASQPLQPSLPQEEQRQETESTGDAAQREGDGNVPTSSSQVEQTEDANMRQDAATDPDVPDRDIQATDEADDNDSLMETATIQSSQQATAGSTTAATEEVTDTVRPSSTRNHLRNYTIGSLHLDSYVDIFNILAAVASKYVDL